MRNLTVLSTLTMSSWQFGFTLRRVSGYSLIPRGYTLLIANMRSPHRPGIGRKTPPFSTTPDFVTDPGPKLLDVTERELLQTMEHSSLKRPGQMSGFFFCGLLLFLRTIPLNSRRGESDPSFRGLTTLSSFWLIHSEIIPGILHWSIRIGSPIGEPIR